MNFTGLTDEELLQAWHDIVAEDQRRRLLRSGAEIADDLIRQYEAAVAIEGPVPFEPMPQFGHGPGAVVVFEGEEWRNVSGAWLSASPADYPLGWSQQTGLPEEAPAWAPGLDVTTGDLYTYNGVTWRVIQAHTTQTGWEPDKVPALWTMQG